MSKRPNIVFILSDQHNAKVLSHKGHPNAVTPNLDMLAEEGTIFDACITANPICTPSRVSFLSGQYCHNHGYYGLSGRKPGGLPTILGHFRKAGYRTAAIGKIHCPSDWVENDTDIIRDTCGSNIHNLSWEYAAYLKEKKLINLEDHAALPEFGQIGFQSLDGRPSKISYRDSKEGWSVTKTIGFMSESIKQKKPFFVHLSFARPHQCYTPSGEFWDMYDETAFVLPPNNNYDISLKAPHFRAMVESHRTGAWTLFEPKTFEAGRLRKLHGYLGNVSQVDFAVGEVLNWLRDRHLEEDTIVVYSSDHGDYACEHDIMEKAPGICSDAITRVPCIWRWPGVIKKGHKVKEIIETVDVASTLCSLAGVEPLQTADGKDITEALEGNKINQDRLGVTEFAWSKSVRKGPWRLVFYPRAMFPREYPGGFGELYNLENDPWEMNNLYFDELYGEMIKDLKLEFIDWLITTTRPGTMIPTSPLRSLQTIHFNGNTYNLDGKFNPEWIRNFLIKENYLNYL